MNAPADQSYNLADGDGQLVTDRQGRPVELELIGPLTDIFVRARDMRTGEIAYVAETSLRPVKEKVTKL
jgi:hypothetical protein